MNNNPLRDDAFRGLLAAVWFVLVLGLCASLVWGVPEVVAWLSH